MPIKALYGAIGQPLSDGGRKDRGRGRVCEREGGTSQLLFKGSVAKRGAASPFLKVYAARKEGKKLKGRREGREGERETEREMGGSRRVCEREGGS